VTALRHANDVAAALDLAVERDELLVLYQPKISLLSGALVGVEALMRWTSPQFGIVEPSIFIPVAERSGAISELTEWGLRTVLQQWREWSEQGIRTDIAFNVSALTLRDLHLPDFIERLCQFEGVPCEQMIIEVTEGATQQASRLLDTITRFRIKGMGVELDDFGTGYSSLLQLRELPYTGIKIDRCFVTDAARQADARLIVSCIIELAHGLGLSVTAEGVEDEETAALLRVLGCDQAQGFFISEPLKGIELAHWVLGAGAQWRRRLNEFPRLGSAA
jgi:EAL domain-containing protein (putative c-di-GMP-specific phosphodiesterase class I)